MFDCIFRVGCRDPAKPRPRPIDTLLNDVIFIVLFLSYFLTLSLQLFLHLKLRLEAEAEARVVGGGSIRWGRAAAWI